MCEPAKGAPLAAAGLTVALAWRVLDSFAEAIALGVFAACAVSIVVLVRLLVPARRPVRVKRAAVTHTAARAALPALPLAIEPPRQAVHVITGARMRARG